MPNVLKDEAVKLAKSMVAQLRFMSIDAHADTLFGKKAPPGDEELEKKIKFLENTLLKDLSYEKDTEDEKFFRMTNSVNNESIKVSNETSTDGRVLAGETLRDLLDSERLNYPEMSVFDIITKAIRNPTYSDNVGYMKSMLVGRNAMQEYGSSMSEFHFNLFVKSLVTELNRKIEAKPLDANIDPLHIDAENLQKIWEGIDVEKIYDLTSDLAKCMELCSNKSEQKAHEGLCALTALLLDDEEGKLSGILSEADPDLYQKVGKVCEKLYKDNFEKPQEAYLKHLCEELDKIPEMGSFSDKNLIEKPLIAEMKGNIERKELITDNSFTGYDENNNEDAVKELCKLIDKANAVNRVLIAAKEADNITDPFLKYKTKIHNSVAKLEQIIPKRAVFSPEENKGLSNLDIIKKDRSSFAYRVVTGFIAIVAILAATVGLAAVILIDKALDNKERFGTSNLFRSEGHTVQAGLLFFNKAKARMDQFKPPQTEKEDEQKLKGPSS